MFTLGPQATGPMVSTELGPQDPVILPRGGGNRGAGAVGAHMLLAPESQLVLVDHGLLGEASGVGTLGAGTLGSGSLGAGLQQVQLLASGSMEAGAMAFSLGRATQQLISAPNSAGAPVSAPFASSGLDAWGATHPSVLSLHSTDSINAQQYQFVLDTAPHSAPLDSASQAMAAVQDQQQQQLQQASILEQLRLQEEIALLQAQHQQQAAQLQQLQQQLGLSLAMQNTASLLDTQASWQVHNNVQSTQMQRLFNAVNSRSTRRAPMPGQVPRAPGRASRSMNGIPAGSGAAPQQQASRVVRASPPTWAGADWNPRAVAQQRITSGTGVFLPHLASPDHAAKAAAVPVRSTDSVRSQFNLNAQRKDPETTSTGSVRSCDLAAAPFSLDSAVSTNTDAGYNAFLDSL